MVVEMAIAGGLIQRTDTLGELAILILTGVACGRSQKSSTDPGEMVMAMKWVQRTKGEWLLAAH